MKFSTKLSLSFTALLAAGLCAVGLVMVGRSFADGLASASATASARQVSEAYAIERTILTDPDDPYAPMTMSAAVQNYAESTPGSRMALFLDGSGSAYSNLPQQIPGPPCWKWWKAGGSPPPCTVTPPTPGCCWPCR